jgi:putative ABC transport system permease protein
VIASLPGQADVMKRGFAAGRYFTAAEARAGVPAVAVSFALGSTIGGGEASAAVGRHIGIRGQQYEVVGVLAGTGPERVPRVYAPIDLAAVLLAPTPRPRAPTLILQAERIEDVAMVRAGVEGWLTGRYGTDWSRKARVHTNMQRVNQSERAILVFKLFLGAITGIALLVGGIGIMNVLLASVTERTREIGVRKAIGARRRDLLAQFLLESVTIAGLGSVIGTLLGVGGAFGVTALMRQRFDAPVHAAFSWGTLAVSAGAAGLAPFTDRGDPARVAVPRTPAAARPPRRAGQSGPSIRRASPMRAPP